VEKTGQPVRPNTHSVLDLAALPCYAIGMMKVGELVRFCAEDDRFHGAKGIIVKQIESNMYQQGFHYEVQTLDGHTIVALDFELERLDNECG